MIRRPPRSTQSRSSAASDVYKRQVRPGPSQGRRPLREPGRRGRPRRQPRGKHRPQGAPRAPSRGDPRAARGIPRRRDPARPRGAFVRRSRRSARSSDRNRTQPSRARPRASQGETLVSARPSVPRLEGEELDLLISRALDGDLSPEETRDLETVLANDPAARRRKEELAGLVAEARALPAPAPPFALST